MTLSLFQMNRLCLRVKSVEKKLKGGIKNEKGI
jgi:hypothetical protein